MSTVKQLGYLAFEVADLDAWEAFATQILGLKVVDRRGKQGFSLRMDGHRQRFFVDGGPADDLTAIGWEVEGPSELADIRNRLSAAGHHVSEGSPEQASQRHVEALIRFEDPAGNSNEVYYGPAMADEPFVSQLVASGFVADDQGLGHVVVLSRDQAEHEEFYSKMLGLKLSDYIRCQYFGHDIDVTFMHANARHHSLAFAKGQHKRIHHFMVQARSVDEVGRCYDRFLFAGGMVHQTLGRHPNDKMFSYYGYTPSGFHFEFGSGAIEIDDAIWKVETHRKVSEWGHHPPQLLTKAYRRKKE
ncbi:MAG: VOC family protein [Myxococcales bacterium]|jgi:2,3-dihydroxybiphenyl 1,2-dioxygenase